VDNQLTEIKQQIKLSQPKAYTLRQVMKKDFHCYLLLLQNNKLGNIAQINREISQANIKTRTIQGQREYTAISIDTIYIYPYVPNDVAGERTTNDSRQQKEKRDIK